MKRSALGPTRFRRWAYADQACENASSQSRSPRSSLLCCWVRPVGPALACSRLFPPAGRACAGLLSAAHVGLALGCIAIVRRSAVALFYVNYDPFVQPVRASLSAYDAHKMVDEFPTQAPNLVCSSEGRTRTYPNLWTILVTSSCPRHRCSWNALNTSPLAPPW